MNHVPRLIQPIVLTLLVQFAPVAAQTTQEHVHGMSHTVMPFDMSKTKHIFSMTDSGGVQRVVLREKADKDQIALIRQHLQHEAQMFQDGNFSDPEHLHGVAMPGLEDVKKGAARIKVQYAPLPDGAQISFDTNELPLVTAIHRWIGAQLSEHGADAEIQ